jgi:hypothetical protein
VFAEAVRTRQPDMLLDAEEPKPTRRRKAVTNDGKVVAMRKRA